MIANAVLCYQRICIIVAQQQGGQYVLIHVTQMLCCLHTDPCYANAVLPAY